MDPILTPLQPDLIAEANHRVANSLTLLGGLVRMQARAVGKAARPSTNAEIRLMLDGIAARVATVGQLHRMLAHTPGNGTVVLNAHLRDIGTALVTAFSSDQQPILIEHSGADCVVLTRHVQPLTLILCEILTNAMKYAHPAGVPVRIAFLCENLSEGVLQLTVSDDGVGLPEDFDAGKDGGLGFQIMRALIAEMNATMEIFSDNLGTTFRLKVPQALVANVQTA
ncbi:MAG: sensor histidine kinase [Rhizomicrobium sp.]